MIKAIFCLLLTIGGVQAQSQRSNPRPVERPSRTVEGLLQRQEAAAKAAAESGGAADAGSEASGSTGGGPVSAGAANESKGSQAPMVFRIGGGEACSVAQRAGWKFFPRGSTGSVDGASTVVEVQPGVWYSKVEGAVVTQRRTMAGWGRISENTFYLFADAQGRTRALAKGWTVRDIRLSGDPFQWVVKPQAGGSSPSMAIQLAGGKSGRDSVVRVESLVLQGPKDAKDWRQAFAAR